MEEVDRERHISEPPERFDAQQPVRERVGRLREEIKPDCVREGDDELALSDQDAVQMNRRGDSCQSMSSDDSITIECMSIHPECVSSAHERT